MKRTAVIAFIVSLLLYSCNQNKPTTKIPVVGEAVDSASIAQDTLQQKSIEESYEYAQTVVVSPKLVYDIRAYGGFASHGEYCIIRRGADNKPDTVVQAARFGVIVNTFFADLNDNGEEEVYVVMKKTSAGASSYVSGFEFDKEGAADPLIFGDSSKTFTINTPVPYETAQLSVDSIFVRDNMLLKHYSTNPVTKANPITHGWKLDGNRFVMVRNN